MLQRFTAIFNDILDSFRVTDAADIVLVSLIFYSLLVWFKETASRRALIGLVVLIAVYFSARAFDMYLTSMMFHTGFAVLVIVLIVVFQDDLRRMLEGIAGWGLLRRFRPGEPEVGYVDNLAETVFNLSETRTGALIVLKGREPIERHAEGGIPLDGKFSVPLLHSLFDASSPGHDGAVVIHDGQIERFSVHLPISSNYEELGHRGTRHSAALGLSECCDSLVVVVSEERGLVSVAESGRIREVSSPAALKTRIERFLAAKHPREPRVQAWRRFYTRHWPLKATSVALAIVAWFAFAYDPATIQRTFDVPIQYRNLPSTLVLDKLGDDMVRLTLSGSERNFRFLEPATLTVSIDLQNADPGLHEIGITDENIRLPVNLSVYRVEPRILRLNLRNRETSGNQVSLESADTVRW